MKYFNIKSIILGIGIGVVITSIISMIYLAGLTPKMSKEEIISKAKEYGMVESLGLIQSKTNDTSQKSTTNILPATTQTESLKLPAVAESTTGSTEVTIIIKIGDSSGVVAKKLLDAGVIKDTTVFSKALSDAGLADNINIGEYKFKKDTDISNIIKTITK